MKVKNERFNPPRPLLTQQSSSGSLGTRLEKFPEPIEVIPVVAPRKIVAPPSTSPTSNDLSRPVVVDIHIPGENGMIKVENHLPQPEIRQKLQVESVDERDSYYENFDTDKPQTRSLRPVQPDSRVTSGYVEMEPSPGGFRSINHQYETVFPGQTHQPDEEYVMEINDVYEPYKTLTTNDFKTIITVGDGSPRHSSISHLDTDAIEQDASSSFGTSPNNWIPNPITKPRRSFLSEASSDSNLGININSDVPNTPPPLHDSNPELVTAYDPDNVALSYSTDEAEVTPVDASKITSPTPKRSKRGKVKNKRAPPIPNAESVEEMDIEEPVFEEQQSPQLLIEDFDAINGTTVGKASMNIADEDLGASAIARDVEVNRPHHHLHHLHQEVAQVMSNRGVVIDEDEIFAELGFERPKGHFDDESHIDREVRTLFFEGSEPPFTSTFSVISLTGFLRPPTTPSAARHQPKSAQTKSRL